MPGCAYLRADCGLQVENGLWGRSGSWEASRGSSGIRGWRLRPGGAAGKRRAGLGGRASVSR